MVMSIVKRDGRAVEKLESGAIEGTPTVEGVQDLVEEALIEEGFTQTAKAYILYRAERNRIRDVNSGIATLNWTISRGTNLPF